DERAELVAIHFRKHDEDVGEAAVRYPHLLAVENVLLTVVTQTRCRFRGHRVRTRTRFSERVSRDQLARRDLRQILLLSRVGGKVDDGQQPDAAFRAKRGRKRSRAPDVLADECAARLIETETTVLFRNVGADQPEISRFADEFAREFPIVLLELVNP